MVQCGKGTEPCDNAIIVHSSKTDLL